MQKQRTIVRRAASALVLGALATASGAWASDAMPQFVMTDLGTLGGSNSRALAINDRGQVVGWSQTQTDLPVVEAAAFLWEDGRMINLGSLRGDHLGVAEARGINNHGEIVGTSDTMEHGREAFYWHDGVMVNLNDLVSVPDQQQDDQCNQQFILREANAISDTGWITGTGYWLPDEEKMFGFALVPMRLEPPRVSYFLVVLDPVQGQSDVEARDTSESGMVVGRSGRAAFRWFDHEMFELDQIMTPVIRHAAANAVSERGQIVGWHAEAGSDPGHQRLACVWDVDGLRKDLGTESGWSSEALDVNESGFAVGWMQEPMPIRAVEYQPKRSAVLWTGCAVENLNDIAAKPMGPNTGWIEEASAINESRQIVGYHRTPQGDTRAYVVSLRESPDFNADGMIDQRDVVDFSQAFFRGEADFNADGRTDGSDFVTFINAFVGGCK